MEETINWLPTIITGGLITIAVFIFVWRVRRMDEIYLTKDTHDNLCKISQLKFQKYVSDQMTDLKENYLEDKFKYLIEVIKDSDK